MRFDNIIGVAAEAGVIAAWASGVWGIYGHFVTDTKVAPGMRLASLLSLLGLAWFVAARWRHHALLGTVGIGHDAAALALLALFNALFWWAVATTRRRRLTLAFSADLPEYLHSAGPYAWVRHPFYTSYLAFWAAAACASGSLAYWLMPAAMAALYWRAIRIEEAKFAASPMAGHYALYKAKTGMLVPALPGTRRLSPHAAGLHAERRP